jgi:hypothetical protein
VEKKIHTATQEVWMKGLWFEAGWAKTWHETLPKNKLK